MPEYFDKSEIDFEGLTYLSGLILAAKMVGRDSDAHMLLGELFRADPTAGLGLAIVVWIDTVAARTGWRKQAQMGGAADLNLINTEDGELLVREQMDPVMQWAINLIMTRITRDEDAFYEHLAQLGDFTWLDYLLTLLAKNLAACIEQQRIASSN